MTREELINKILDIRPTIAKKEELEHLDEQKLIELLNANKNLNYYKLLIKQQMIGVIIYVYGERYSKCELYALSFEEIRALYLLACKINEKEFEKRVDDALENFKNQSEGNEEIDGFTRDEQIIASGVLVPDDLLTEEEFETKSTLKILNDISEKIKELEQDAELTKNLLDDPNITGEEKADYRNELLGYNIQIQKLKEEIKKIMFSNQSDETKTAKRSV